MPTLVGANVQDSASTAESDFESLELHLYLPSL
jgi:hypothetical protein